METDTVIQDASVWLFKNGYGVVERPIPLPKEEHKITQTVQIDNPPRYPVHGTFWVWPTAKNTTIQSILTQDTTREVESPCLSILELLLANIGKHLDLSVRVQDRVEKRSGVVLEIPKPKPTKSGNDDLHSHNHLVLLQNENGIEVVNVQSIDSVHLSSEQIQKGVKLSTSFKKSVQDNSLAIKYVKAAGEATLNVRYLTHQITWAPSYHIRLSETEKTCVFSLKGVILNDAESLNCKKASLVTGFPNMQFKNVTDPMSKDKKSLSEFLGQLANVGNEPDYGAPVMMQQRRRGGSSVMQQSLMTNVMSNAFYSSAPVDDTPTPAPTNDDLYIYTVSDVALPRGERVYTPIFDLEIPYADVYHTDLNAGENTQDVWHSIRIKNATKFPWTTAPVTITRGDNFIAQDTSGYTPANEESLINLTKAYTVKVLFEEKSEGTKNRISIFNYSYAIYITKGQISITNLKSEDVIVSLKKFMVGDLKSSSVNPKTNIEKPRVDVANSQRNLVWEVTVPAGKNMTIEYVYHTNRRT